MNQNPQKTSEKTTGALGNWVRVSIAAAVICVGLGFIAGGIGYQAPRPGTDRLTDLGNFGSYLQGTTASFWSLAGVLLIVATFLTQQRQLNDQDRQFKIQNDSINRTRKDNRKTSSDSESIKADRPQKSASILAGFNPVSLTAAGGYRENAKRLQTVLAESQ